MNNFAISSTGIGEAMQRSASALYEAGNTIDESIALITAANSVIQNPEQVGTALKTLALRLRGAKVELEEAGEDVDGMAESTSQLQEKLLALTHGKVDIMLDENTFKNTTQILREMSAAWEHMTDIERASALELMGGKRQANILSSVIKNFDIVEDVIEKSVDSSGSALAENEKYLESIQGRIDLFNNAVQTMWMNLIDSSVVKGVVDIGTTFVKFLDSGAGKVAALSAAIAVLGKVLKINAFSSVNGELQIFGKTIDTIRNNFTKLSAESTGIFGKLKAGLASVFTDGNKIDISKILSQDVFDNELTKAIDIFKSQGQIIDEVNWGKYVDGVSQADAAMGAALKTCEIQNGTIIAGSNAYQTYTSAATGAAVGTTAVGGAAQTTTGKLIAMKVAALAANAALTLGLSLLVSLAVQGISAWANAGEAAREAAQDAANASQQLREQTDSLKDYKAEISSLRTELDSNNLSEAEAYDARERLLQIQNELIDKYGEEAKGINLVTGELEKQKAVIDSFSQKESQQWLDTHKSEYLDAIEYFDSDNKGSFLDHWYEGFGATRISNYAVPDEIKKIVADFASTQDNMSAWTDNLGFHNVDFNGSVEEVKTQVDDFISFLNEQEERLNKEIKNAEVSGDLGLADTLRKNLKSLQDYQKDIGKEYTNWFGENSTYAANKTVMDEAKYQTAMAKYTDQYMDILDAQNKLTEAQAKGGPETIKSAIDVQQAAIEKAMKDAEANGQSWMVDYFKSFADGLAEQEFEINVKLNEDGLQDQLNTIVQTSGLSTLDNNQIFDMVDRGLNVEGATDASGQYTAEQISGLVALQAEANKAGISIESLITILTALGLVASKPIEQSAESVKIVSETYSALLESVESYNEIISQTSEIVADNTEVTQEYKDSLTALGISEEELSECFDENNGLIVKNAALLNKLVKQKKQDQKATIQQAKAMGQLQYKNTVQQLQQVVKAMALDVKANGLVSSATLNTISVLREQLSTLKETIQQYALLEISLSDAANAYSEFEAAKERDAQLTYGDSMIEMLQTINEGFKTGRVGTEAFEYAVKVLVPEDAYANIDDIEQRMIAIHDYIDKNPLFADWFTIDEGEFSITLDNINAFIDDAFGAGLFTGDSSGEFFLTEAIKNAQDPLKEFADQLGKAFNTEVTEGSVLAMLSELEKYDASWGNILTDLTTTPLDRAINDATTALEAAIIAQEEFITSGGDLNSDAYKTLETNVINARIALDEASKAAATNAQSYSQVEAVLKGMSGEIKYSQEQADALARSLGLINENGHITINIETGALELTDEQLEILNQKLVGLSKPTILDVQLAYDELDRQIQELEAYKKDSSANKILTELDIDSTEVDAKIAELTSNKEAIELVYNITTTSTEQSTSTLEKLGTWEANGVQITISGDASAFDATVSATNAVEMDGKTVPIDADPTEANANMDAVDNREIEDKEPGIYMQGVGYALDDIDRIDDALWALPDRDIYVNVHYREYGAVGVNGTANVDGTARISGAAFADGNWGTPRTEVALTGELGPEMVVRDGRWFTVGENGAEFTQIKKGDIIFNHKNCGVV